MIALVTGSTGFVGANLVEGLAAAGHEVRALHRKSSRLDALAGLRYEPVVGDVLDPESLRAGMAGADWVFHVAAIADYWRQGGAARLYHVNVGGTRQVLQAALASGVRRVVFTSSGASLGVPACNSRESASAGNSRDSSDCLLVESATFNLPASLCPYGHSKHLAEQMVQEFVARGLEVVTVNPTVILGPRDINQISGSLILALCRGLVPVIPPGGVNYIDVADVVAGHIAAAERGRLGERYILGAHNLTHRQALETIARVLGTSPPSVRLPPALMETLARAVDVLNFVWPGEPLTDGNQVRLMRYTIFYDGTKAQQELGLGPSIPFPCSVERTFRWYRDNGYL
jgi:dihydroflavonol-4-reductase